MHHAEALPLEGLARMDGTPQVKNLLQRFGGFTNSDVPVVARSVRLGRWRVIAICRTHMGFRLVRKTQSGSRIEPTVLEMVKTRRQSSGSVLEELGARLQGLSPQKSLCRQATELSPGDRNFLRATSPVF